MASESTTNVKRRSMFSPDPPSETDMPAQFGAENMDTESAAVVESALTLEVGGKLTNTFFHTRKNKA